MPACSKWYTAFNVEGLTCYCSHNKADLLVLFGGDLLQEVRHGLALWHIEALALEEGHHRLLGPMKDQVACTTERNTSGHMCQHSKHRTMLKDIAALSRQDIAALLATHCRAVPAGRCSAPGKEQFWLCKKFKGLLALCKHFKGMLALWQTQDLAYFL